MLKRIAIITSLSFIIFLLPSISSAYNVPSDSNQCCLCYRLDDIVQQETVQGIPQDGSCLPLTYIEANGRYKKTFECRRVDVPCSEASSQLTKSSQCCVCYRASDQTMTEVIKGAPSNGICPSNLYDPFVCRIVEVDCEKEQTALTQLNNKTEKRGLPINVPTLEVLGGIIKLQDHLKLTDTKDASGNQYYEIPWIAEAISSLYKFGVSAAAILAVIMIIVGGFIWLTSAGNQTQITEAKGYIFGAAIGLLIALGSYVLLYTINPELVRLKPIKIPYVEHEDLLTITSEENQQPDDGGGGNASSYSGGQNNGMRYYNQGDEGDIPGFHKWGCACSSVAMAISKFGGNLTPTGCAHKYIKPPENMNIPGKRIIDVSSALKDNKLQVEKVESLGDAKTRITAAIKNGSVIIALIKSGSTGHYLIIANADDIGVSLLDPGRRSNTGCTWNELISGIPGDKSRRPLRSYYIISK